MKDEFGPDEITRSSHKRLVDMFKKNIVTHLRFIAELLKQLSYMRKSKSRLWK